MGQVIQQMLVLGASLAVYVSASETGILYIVIVQARGQILAECGRALTGIARRLVEWAHGPMGQ